MHLHNRLSSLFLLALLLGLQACGQGNPPSSETPPAEPPLPPTPPTVTPEKISVPEQLTYAWLETPPPPGQTLAERIPTPAGYQRVSVKTGSFGEWLRFLPMKPGKPPVHLYNGELKGNQTAHHAVVDIDVGNRDLQQCADAVMRLRAEYLYGTDQYEQIHFNFVSGEKCDWDRWRAGKRPVVRGSQTTWKASGSADDSYPNFKKYLQMVYMYAGTASLTHELDPVDDLANIQPGDVFILGGSPGHAVIVLDVAEHPESGEKLFLLAQSYMPAQEIHLLKNPNNGKLSPWYSHQFGTDLLTPEWDFRADQLKRF